MSINGGGIVFSRLRAVSIVYILIFLSGCSIPYITSYEHPSIIAGSEEETRVTVKYVRQINDYSCGLASLTMVLNYWDVSPSQEELVGKYPPASREKGYTIGELKMIAKELGLQAYGLQGEIDFLKKQISLGRPVICVLEKSQDNGLLHVMRKIPIMGKISLFIWTKLLPQDRHFVVVTGFSRKNFLLIDPVSGISRMSINRFQTIWGESQHASLLVAR